MSDWRVIIAFGKPPKRYGFTESKSGQTWFRQIEGIAFAKQLASELVKLNIHGIIKRGSEPKAPRPYEPRINGQLGTNILHTSRTAGFSASCKNRSNKRRRGRGRRGM